MYTGKKIFGMFIIGMLLMMPFPGEGGEYLLHRIPLDGSTTSTVHGDEWIVEEVVITKGATLWGFSRSHLGKGHYYPHLLAYNDIANPNRIWAGKTLLVPVSKVRDYQKRSQLQGKTWSVSFADLALEAVSKEREKRSVVRHVSPPQAPGKPKASVDRALSEQREFDMAKAEFDAGRYEKAARLFDRFVIHHPHSKLKADALFYAAEAHLKTSETP